MELSKHYDPAALEQKWYRHWLDRRYFNSVPDSRTPYTIVIPPPNVTGVLHMGHTLNETVQDILIRRARMLGFNACWVPGSDHASIATEARVVKMLQEQGIEKRSLSREEFLRHAYAWKEKYGNLIYGQIARLGCSVDWDRVDFTMDDHYYKAVIKVFVDLFGKKLIYRGARMINWDPAARTALSDEEVEYRDVEGTLYYVKYAVADSDEFVTIATQRPETIPGDTAVCVNPGDPRYRHLIGREAIVPLVNRRVPVIADDYIDMNFGTGVLKVTPAHDINDYNLGLKHNLRVIDTLNEDGTLSAAAEVFVGLDRFAAREKAVETLAAEGLIAKEETYPTRLGYSQRSNAVVEPRISTQWFVDMKGLAQPALKAVTDGDIRIHPAGRFDATYKYWLENVKDWCISRQLWWGQRIPAWYDAEGNMVVAETAEAAGAAYERTYGKSASLTQDEDVLDTWFSSWLWPMEVFRGITEPGNPDISYYYPTNTLVTGQDIIFFWVSRMIMAGMEYRKEKPFSDVYFTGIVRDKLGRKMSKSLGNSPDLIELIDRFGADAVRFGILISAPAGNDLLFDEAGLEQGRNFNNKIWNALKLVLSWKDRVQPAGDEDSHFAVDWFAARLAAARQQVDKLLDAFRISEALKTLYSLIWDDFCSWYLEWAKPAFGAPVPAKLYEQTISFFEELMQLLHPFAPFITEEVYHRLRDRAEGDDLCIRQYGEASVYDPAILESGRRLQELLTAGREFRQQHAIKNTEPLAQVWLPAGLFAANDSLLAILRKQLNVENVSFFTPGQTVTAASPEGTLSRLPFGEHHWQVETVQAVDQAKRREELEKELVYFQGFLASLDKKLGNERFTANAKPEVVDLERKKKSDTEAKIRMLEETMRSLK